MSRRRLHERGDRVVAEVGEVLGAPVVPLARRVVDHALEVRVRHRADEVDLGAERAQRRDRARRLPMSDRSSTTRSATTGWPCRCSGTNSSGGPVRNAAAVASFSEAPSAMARYACSTSSPDSAPHSEQARVHDRADVVQLELERRRDAEVAAAAVQRPEQIGVRVLARRDLLAVGEDEVDRDEVVAREAVLALEPTRAAAERQSGDARRRHAAADGREPVLLRGPVERRPGDAAADASPLRLRIDRRRRRAGARR